MKRIILLLLFDSILYCLFAQSSHIEQIQFPSSYETLNELVRNYDDNNIVFTSFGYDHQSSYPNDTVKEYTSFYIKNIPTGDIVNIVNLPGGWKVNDFRFVTLRGGNGIDEDFCCFCGTRVKISGVVYSHTIGDEPVTVTIVYDTSGFAGFFSMTEALNPSSSNYAVYRDVEGTKELYRMTCYSELFGAYYNGQNTFMDNIVMDIIGLPKNIMALSSFARVKVYPDYNDTVRWDNNLRYNTNSLEVLSDVINTSNYVVTASTIMGSSNKIIIRLSDKEDHFFNNGMELNSHVQQIIWTDSSICQMVIGVNPQVDVSNPLRLCHISNDVFLISFYAIVDKNSGIFTLKFDCSNDEKLIFLNGKLLKDDAKLSELVYLPQYNATATLSETIERNIPVTSLFFWRNDCYDPYYRIEMNGFRQKSLCSYRYYSDEYLFWCGLLNNGFEQLGISDRLVIDDANYINGCHRVQVDNSTKVKIALEEAYHEMKIMKRYPYDPIHYINRKSFFSILFPNHSNICEYE
ncbi:MAG: hypothetical protein K6D59_04855 [Bacteroidales bacterium]|nr:hypothetical protein [Bacteroidales bacterium]